MNKQSKSLIRLCSLLAPESMAMAISGARSMAMEVSPNARTALFTMGSQRWLARGRL